MILLKLKSGTIINLHKVNSVVHRKKPEYTFSDPTVEEMWFINTTEGCYPITKEEYEALLESSLDLINYLNL